MQILKKVLLVLVLLILFFGYMETKSGGALRRESQGQDQILREEPTLKITDGEWALRNWYLSELETQEWAIAEEKRLSFPAGILEGKVKELIPSVASLKSAEITANGVRAVYNIREKQVRLPCGPSINKYVVVYDGPASWGNFTQYLNSSEGGVVKYEYRHKWFGWVGKLLNRGGEKS